MNIKKLMYFGYYFVYVMTNFFLAAYLIQQNNDPVLIGYTFSLGILISVILMLILGYLEDNSILSIKYSIILLIILSLLSYILMFNSYALIGYLINVCAILALPGALDSFVLHEEKKENYSSIRMFGSLGAAFSYFFSSYILGGVNIVYILYSNIIFLLVLLYFITRSTYKPNKNKQNYLLAFKDTLSNKHILYILIITFLTYGVIKGDDAFGVVYNMQYAKLSSFAVGITGFLAIIFEVYVMSLYKSLVQKYSFKRLLTYCCLVLMIIFIIKYQFYSISYLVIFANIILGIYIGLFIPIVVNIISNESDNKTQSSFIFMYQVAISLGGVVISFFTTTVLKYTDFLPSIYLFHFILVLIAFILVLTKYRTNSK